MKKREYSLTAKERKELRQKSEKKSEKQPEAVSVSADGEETVVVEKKTMQWWVILAIVLAALLGVTAILGAFSLLSGKLFFVYPIGEYRDVNNPVAKIELSNGMVLEFEIYEDTCPTAATNFIYLARNNFFTDTIIFDNQQGWVRFGDYTTMTKQKSTYNSDNKAYLDSLPGIEAAHSINPLGYRLKADSSSDAKRISEEGMLTFNYQRSSCQFFITSRENCQTRLNGTDYKPTVVGRYLNDKTLNYIKEIAALESDQDSPNSVWKNPTPVITIKKVTIYNLDSAKWKNFHFENYMEDVENGGTNSVVSSWTA